MVKEIRKDHLVLFYREDSIDLTVIDESFEDNILLNWFPEYRIKSRHNILDVGAHIGAFSIYASVRARKGKIYSIEADSENFLLLDKNVKTNKLSNIATFNFALAADDGKITLFHDISTGNWGHTICKKISDDSIEVESKSLNSFFAENLIERIDLAKFNCEGAEFSILLNSSDETIRKVKNIVIYFHLDLERNYTLDHLLDFLHNHRFFTDIRLRNSSEGQLLDRGCIIAKRYSNFFTLVYFRLVNKFYRFILTIKLVIKKRFSK